MKRVVVIGANGFIGYHLTQHLLAQQVEVVALVPMGFDDAHVRALSVQCMSFSFDTLHTNIIEVCRDADVLYNMVWAGMNPAERNNVETQVSNLLYNVRVIEMMVNHHIRKLVVPGSAAQYACSGRIIDGIGESAPSDLYSAAKASVYDYCKVLCKQKDIELVWTLITSIYGPGRDDNNLISYTIKTLLRGERPSFTGLEQQWDYLFIDDLMKALCLLGEKGQGGKVYPIGSGEHRQMREYVQIIRDNIDSELPLGIGDKPYKNPIIDNQIIDITELVKDTAFQPNWTFEKGINETIAWFKKQ